MAQSLEKLEVVSTLEQKHGAEIMEPHSGQPLPVDVASPPFSQPVEGISGLCSKLTTLLHS